MLSGFEMKLFSEARFVADAPDHGPYDFLNSIVIPAFESDTFILKPGITLRTEWYLPSQVSPMKATDDDHYHGGWHDDELAALVGLIFGVRIAAGPVDRDFATGSDPLGRPRAYASSFAPNLPALTQRPQIPSIFGTRDLRDISLIDSFPELERDGATCLVKSARLYQQALWISDSAPEVSWLLLISSLETAASFHDTSDLHPLERLERSFPKLVEMLREDTDHRFVEKIAGELGKLTGATGKFLRFCKDFSPGPPEERAEFGRVDFDPPALSKALGKIYGYRSRALHGGTPFPAPMCQPPHTHINRDGFPEERPFSSAASAKGATWVADDTPMLLHTFAYIARGALLNWWKSQI